MDFVRRNSLNILILVGLAAAYFVLRVPHLTLQPIFADEAIYIRWAQVMKSEPTLRFISLSDGKTPLFMWLLIPLFKVFSDPLVAGRFLSVMAGFFTLLGIFFLTRKVFGKTAGLWAAFLYVITPYTVFFDRMALVDSMESAFTVWIIYLAVMVVEKMRLDLAMILGYLLGGVVLTKTPGMLNSLILPVSILGFKRVKSDKYRLVRLVMLWGVAVVIALVMYNMLRLGPNFQSLSSRNADYVFSPFELMGRPLDPFIPHFHDMTDWFPKLFTWPILLSLAAGLVFLVKSKNKLGWIVLLWALIPMLLSMAFLKTFTARYLLTSVAPMLVIAGYGLWKVSQVSRVPQVGKVAVIAIVVGVLPLWFDYQLVNNPPPGSLPKEERKGYFEQWTAGYGLKQIAAYLIAQKTKGPVVVGTDGYFGTLPDGLYIYLDKADIAVIGGTGTVSAKLRESAKEHQTYYVGNKEEVVKSAKHLIEIMEFPKTRSLDTGLQDATVLYQVLPMI